MPIPFRGRAWRCDADINVPTYRHASPTKNNGGRASRWPRARQKGRAHRALTVESRVPNASQPDGKLHLEQVRVCRILPWGDRDGWRAAVFPFLVLPDVVGRHPRGPPVLGEGPRRSVRLARRWPQLTENVHLMKKEIAPQVGQQQATGILRHRDTVSTGMKIARLTLKNK